MLHSLGCDCKILYQNKNCVLALCLILILFNDREPLKMLCGSIFGHPKQIRYHDYHGIRPVSRFGLIALPVNVLLPQDATLWNNFATE